MVVHEVEEGATVRRIARVVLSSYVGISIRTGVRDRVVQ